MSRVRFALALIITSLGVMPLVAQVPLPQTINIPTTNYGGGSVFSGAFTNASQSAGIGYTLRQYGNSTSGGAVLFTAPTANPAVLTLSTRSFAGGAASAPNGSADVFSSSTSYNTPATSFTIFAPRNTSASIFIPTTSGGSAYFDLTDNSPENVAAANARLNEALSFDQSKFIDQAGNPVTSAVGKFYFTLENYSATAGFQNINLNYAPVPEPAGLLALAFGGLAGAARLRRFVIA